MRLQKLFEKVRTERAPEPSAGFEARVTRALPDREPALSLFDQLNGLFPRSALASALILGLCFGIELFGSGFERADLSSNLAQFSDQWLFTTKGF
jgi:hypothetical protein